MSKRITLDNLKTFLTQLKTHITDPIKNDVSTLTTKVRNAENNIITANSNISSVQQALNDKADKNHNHTIADVDNLQTTLDGKAPEKYILQFEGAISNNFREKIIGTTEACGFVKSFRKNDNSDACMTPYGAGLAWGQVGTHAMLYADINNPLAYISAGNNNKLNWYKQIAFKEDLTNLQKTLFIRNDGVINKNINNCFDAETGKFKANESGQYLIMCSGYELPSDTSTYVGCVVSGTSGNQNPLYNKGTLSGFTFITLEKEQTLSLHVCVTGNITHNCISNDNSVNMLIAKIK